MLGPQFEKELEQLQDRDSFAVLVRRAIQERLTGYRPGIEDVARSLHISARTLQRRLQETGSSYQCVLHEARHQMARYYLGNSVLELNEAAYLLEKPWIVPIPGTTKLSRIDENLGALSVELTPDDLRKIDASASQLTPQGGRYPEHLEPMTGR